MKWCPYCRQELSTFEFYCEQKCPKCGKALGSVRARMIKTMLLIGFGVVVALLVKSCAC